MSDLLIHEKTKHRLEALQKSPAHAILFAGPGGSGKFSLAKRLAEALLGLEPGAFENYAYKLILRPEAGKAIGIEAVRVLEHFMSLKVPVRQAVNRIVIIEDSHMLTAEAQNALLKTLEEPTEGAVLILTASYQQALLPTLRSRTRIIPIYQPSRESVEQYYAGQGFDPVSIRQALSVSGGLPGLVHAMLTESDHPLLVATEKARSLLSQPLHLRLLSVDELSKDRTGALNVTFILQQMAHQGLQTAKGATARKWQTVQRASYEAGEALRNNAQPKLALLNLALQL